MSKPNFDRCMFNPFSESMSEDPRLRKLMDDAYKALEEMQEIKQIMAGNSAIDPVFLDDRLLRYIICLYDPFSPLIKMYPDLSERKVQAALIAGYSDDKDNTDFLYGNEHEVIVTLIVGFLKIVNNRLWASIVSIEQVIWELNERMMLKVQVSIEDKDKDLIGALNMKPKMAKDIIELNDLLIVQMKKFYGEDEVVYHKAQKITPQSVALMSKQ
jgi:hypothetical protein